MDQAFPLSAEQLQATDAYWRAANYLSVGQIYLYANPLLRQPLLAEHVKPRLLGHWGTTPGLNFIYAHLNRIIKKHDLDMVYVMGPGHGGPGVVANCYLEGTYSEVYPEITQDEEGLRKLFRQFSFPGGIPSHVSPELPGSFHEGGELGYSLSHAFGAAFDYPDLIVTCVVGDGEAETGPLATSWHSNKFLNPARDGAVLPILHLNGYKIANPAVLARIPEEELSALLVGYGYEPHFVSGSDPEQMHQKMAATLDLCVERIREIQQEWRQQPAQGYRLPDRVGPSSCSPPQLGDDPSSAANSAQLSGNAPPTSSLPDPPVRQPEQRLPRPAWPMIVLRTPKGWTGPREVDGKQTEGSWRSHQVPFSDARQRPEHLELLDTWMRSYRPEELFTEAGALRPELQALAPHGFRRMGSNPHANGGVLLEELQLPPIDGHAVAVNPPGTIAGEATRTLGHWLRDVMEANPKNFRLFGPDETASNRLDAVFEFTGKTWLAEREPSDDQGGYLSADGRVMEILSEHTCQGWLEGYLLTGGHGLFSCYEAFIHLVDSMFNQHAKWLKVSRNLGWRSPIASLNYLLTSHVWRQDHNGFSHQDPGFIDHVVNKKAEVVRVYLPPDANTLLCVAEHCLRSHNYVNVIVAGKQPALQFLDLASAREHCGRGLGIWDWASNDCGVEPDVVFACAGDVPTLEALAAVSILREHFPDLKIRFINVVDLMCLQPHSEHPHGLSHDDFDAYFTTDRPIIFAYHGYPWLIHRLTYKRHGHEWLHVRGYKEEGTTTTPFDMTVRNNMDRFSLANDAVDRILRLQGRIGHFKQWVSERLLEHKAYIESQGEDMPAIRDWVWPTSLTAGQTSSWHS